ncbi:MAG: hypothetical protein AB7F98_17930 [Novosphingobium sp.]
MSLDLRGLKPGMALALIVALPACGGEKRQETKGTAGGEILEASVSDAMLPTDQVRSQPPLAPRTQAAGEKGGGRDKAAGDEADSGENAADDAAAAGSAADSGAAAPATPDGE